MVLAAAAAIAATLAAGGCAREPASPDAPVSHDAPTVPDVRFHDSPTFSDQGTPTLVTPRAGMANVRAHPFTAAMRHADDRGVRVAFWGGVAPCFVLDRAEVREAPHAVTITLFAGSDPASADVACIEIAMLMAVDVPLPSPLAGRPLVDGADGSTKPLGR